MLIKHMRYLIIFIVALALAAEETKTESTASDSIAALKAENAKLKEQLEAFRRAVALEMRIQAGALQACREVAAEAQKQTEKPAPK